MKMFFVCCCFLWLFGFLFLYSTLGFCAIEIHELIYIYIYIYIYIDIYVDPYVSQPIESR